MNALLQRIWSFLTATASVCTALLLTGLVVAGIFEPAYWEKRERSVSFDGIIERKEIGPGGRFSARYFVVVRQENGKTVRFQVDRSTYDRARVGMRARKAAGEQWPHIGEAVAAPDPAPRTAAQSLTIGRGFHGWVRRRLSDSWTSRL